jgi:glycerate kinase
MEPPLLICAQPFDTLEARGVAQAVAAGFTAAGRQEPDVIELPAEGDVKALLAEHRFEARMRAAFAVVICTEHLRDGELRGTLAAEMATGARQTGVACHAICAENAIEPFTARIYDLQTIRTAATLDEFRDAARALSAEL